MMEGVASEAASLAGHLSARQAHRPLRRQPHHHRRVDRSGLHRGRLRALRGIRLARAEGRRRQRPRTPSTRALAAAKAETDRPSLIAVRTHIGFGCPNRQDTSKAHGEPLGVDEVKLAKERLGWPLEPSFLVPDEVQGLLRGGRRARRGRACGVARAPRRLERRRSGARRGLGRSLVRRSARQAGTPTCRPTCREDGGLATRAASGQVINAVAPHLPGLIGGSADLAPSNNTWIKGEAAQQAATPAGRNLHFGVREHAMAAIANGLALHGGLRPYIATFFVFTDYMRPAMRLAALMEQPVDLRAHARQHRSRRGRPHASARRASRSAARHSRAGRSCVRPTPTRRSRPGRWPWGRPMDPSLSS